MDELIHKQELDFKQELIDDFIYSLNCSARGREAFFLHFFMTSPQTPQGYNLYLSTVIGKGQLAKKEA